MHPDRPWVCIGCELEPAVVPIGSYSTAWNMSFKTPSSTKLTVEGIGEPTGQAERPISTGQLHVLPRFYTRPINVVVYDVPSGKPHLEVGFPLRCFQRLSVPDLATQRCHWHDNWNTRGPSIPVLSY